ncbi:ParA family protein [Ciceribacter sp. L1K22]|uniref:ParA family protein n=1 Tax=Ciceribacter sp. L1K22 TaxID=2820275 RepID=UPI001ABE8EF3|nr:ParA family protein [Ciceribacter sp. L1K22]MBO3760419.1 ParA family protein [Ciceribacter sp. L1K22]
MPIMTFANTKGGAGKTTAVFVLASELVRRGTRVTILDADPRGWISRWHALAACGGLLQVVAVDEHSIEDAAAKARKRGGYTLIDLPSSHDALLAKAVGLADHVMIPVQGCAMDAVGGAQVLELLGELERQCDIRIPHSVVLTRVNIAVTTRALQAAKDFLAGRNIHTLSTPIAERAAYRDVFGKGGLLQALNGEEVSNLDRALENAAQLANEVLALVPSRAARTAARKIADAKPAKPMRKAA